MLFCFVLHYECAVLLQLFDCIMNYKKEETEVLLGKLGITLKPDDKEKDGKALLKVSVSFVFNIQFSVVSKYFESI